MNPDSSPQFSGNPDAHEFSAAESATRELQELGIEARPENIETVLELQRARQHPDGFEDVTAALGSPDELKRLMQEKGLTSIIHSEGPALWDHVRLALEDIEKQDLPPERKTELKLAMLYHDLGKTTAVHNETNVAQTKKKLAKGELHQSAIGHATERLPDIAAGLRANGADGEQLKTLMTVLENHMNTSLLEQDPKKTVKLLDGFGANNGEIRRAVELLAAVLQADGNATEHVDLVDGELRYSKNEKKLKLNADAVWAKFEEGRQLLHDEEEKKLTQTAEEHHEIEILGMRLSDYLRQVRDMKPGPDLGKAISAVKNTIRANADKTPTEIKGLIDQIQF
jgi:hypothetical protein